MLNEPVGFYLYLVGWRLDGIVQESSTEGGDFGKQPSTLHQTFQQRY
jgi:hypothetical protein